MKTITMDYEEYSKMEENMKEAIKNLREFKEAFSTHVEKVGPYTEYTFLIIDGEKLKQCFRFHIEKIIIKSEGEK